MLALSIAMCVRRYVDMLPGAVLCSFYFRTYLCFQSCLSDLGTVSGRFKDVVDFGFSQLSSSAIKPRIRPLADAFLSISHNITEASVVKRRDGVSPYYAVRVSVVNCVTGYPCLYLYKCDRSDL